MAALTPGGGHLDHLVESVSPMVRGGWHQGAGFERHLSVPFVVAALAGCYDTHHDRLLEHGQTVIEEIIVELAEFNWEQLTTTSWGDPARMAFNHTVIAYAALGAAAVSLLERHPDAGRWLEMALDRCARFLDEGLSHAGMTWEGITYCGFDFKYVGVFLCGLRTRGLDAEIVPPNSPIESKLRLVPTWYAHEMLPTGSYLQNFNDSTWDPHRALWGFLLTFAKYEPDLCATIWDRLVGNEGLRTYGADRHWSSLAEAMIFYPGTESETSLEPLDDVFFAADVGYLSARDSWKENATVFSFNSGPFLDHARVHDQADNNSFALVAGGTPMVIDSGMADDAREGSPSSSFGHNLVFIDGVGEHPAGQGIGVSGRIVAFGCADEAVCVVGDATSSYCHRDFNSVKHALRTAVFVRRPFPYVLIYDDINKDDGAHLYEFLVHVPELDDASLSTGRAGATVQDPGRRAIGSIDVLHPSDAHAAAGTYRAYHEPFRDHRVLRVQTTRVNPRFLTLLRPLPATAEQPTVEVEENDGGLRVILRWSETIDTFALRDGAAKSRHWSKHPLPSISRSLSGGSQIAWSRRYEG